MVLCRPFTRMSWLLLTNMEWSTNTSPRMYVIEEFIEKGCITMDITHLCNFVLDALYLMLGSSSNIARDFTYACAYNILHEIWRPCISRQTTNNTHPRVLIVSLSYQMPQSPIYRYRIVYRQHGLFKTLFQNVLFNKDRQGFKAILGDSYPEACGGLIMARMFTTRLLLPTYVRDADEKPHIIINCIECYVHNLGSISSHFIP